MFGIESYEPHLAPSVVALWDAAMGEEFPLTERLLRQNTEGDARWRPADGFVAVAGRRPVGFAFTVVDSDLLPGWGSGTRARGWISAFAVHPAHRGQGCGRALLAGAEEHLRQAGAREISVGADPHHLFPGVPVGFAPARALLKSLGYSEGGHSYDVMRDIGGFTMPSQVEECLRSQPQVTIRPCAGAQVPGLVGFLEREFPGGWLSITRWYLDRGGAPEDIIIMLDGDSVEGFCHVNHGGSNWLGPNVYWHRLLGPTYGGLGPIGISASHRGRGLGFALLCRSVAHLQRLGVRRMCIDWTDLLDFYGKIGFRPWKEYVHVSKVIA